LGRHGPEGDAGQGGVDGVGGDLAVEPGGKAGRVAPGVVGAGREEGIGAGGEEGDGGAEAPAVVGVAVGRGAAELLRGGIAGRAGRAALRLAGGPGVLQVDNEEIPVVVHENVVGVEVADDDAVGVEGGHRLGEGGGQFPGFIGGEGHGRTVAPPGVGGVPRKDSALHHLTK
jgi:hypothetical protein